MKVWQGTRQLIGIAYQAIWCLLPCSLSPSTSLYFWNLAYEAGGPFWAPLPLFSALSLFNILLMPMFALPGNHLQSFEKGTLSKGNEFTLRKIHVFGFVYSKILVEWVKMILVMVWVSRDTVDSRPRLKGALVNKSQVKTKVENKRSLPGCEMGIARDMVQVERRIGGITFMWCDGQAPSDGCVWGASTRGSIAQWAGSVLLLSSVLRFFDYPHLIATLICMVFKLL
jgi:hypothetical protein